ncbi:MAG: glycine betaine ABC transporter substrate-binding protein [Chloroflexota bacterium]|nr:glycine betaine ABC transporter substrate-binding protein [Chloroflexota bacterium]
MKKHLSILFAFFMITALLLGACKPAPTEAPAEAEEAEEAPEAEEAEEEVAAEVEKSLVIVGSKDFTEQIILGNLSVLALTDAGFDVDNQVGLGGTAVNREALLTGEIDMYWEYTGTGWISQLGHEDPITDPQECYDKVKAEDAGNGLNWMAMAPFNNTYTLMMQQSVGDELGIASISDLSAYINGGGDASLCINQEFYARPDGFRGVEELYGFQFDEDQVIMMDSGLTYKALQDGECTTAMGFATDGRIPAFGFFNLVDDLQYFPVYNPAPVIRQDVLDANPDIADIFAPIAEALTTEVMMDMNKRVDIDEEDPADVARDFLDTYAAGYEVSEAAEPVEEEMATGLVIVGSKDFTEQIILGNLSVIALADAGFDVDNQVGLGGTAVNREALLTGEIDMYWEYTGTGWISQLGHEDPITDPQECYDKVKAEDAGNGLNWLAMAPFNNTYTLMMQQSVGDELGIESISDLAAYINGGGDASLCINQEFYARPDGFRGVEELYGFQFDEDQVIMMDSGLTYKALQDGECTTAMGFATDGRIPAFGFFNLTDDLQYFPVYNPAPVVRQEIMDAYPGIATVLDPIAQALTTEKMMELNKSVDIEEVDPYDVACDFLTTEGLVESCP